MKKTPQTHPVIAIDFDGTIVKDSFPDIGEPHDYAIKTINKMVELGYEVVIWTCRADTRLVNAQKKMKNAGLNQSIKWNQHPQYMLDRYNEHSPKIGASVYLDDKSYNAPNFENEWKTIYNIFC